MIVTLPEPGPPNPEFERPADRKRLDDVMGALGRRGFAAEIADNRSHACRLALDALPEGAEVHAANSETLRQLGVTAAIDESGRYDSVRAKLKALDRQTQARDMRKLAAAPDFILGSAHAITNDGEILVASGTGSQLGAYAYSAGRVILLVGHQKLVRDVAEGFRRIREYCHPKEHERVRAAGRPGSVWSETLILNRDPRNRVRVIFVPDTVGF